MASVHQKLFAVLVVAILAVSMSSNVAAGRILQENGITEKDLNELTSGEVPQRRTIPQYAVTDVYKAYLENLLLETNEPDENKAETAEEQLIEIAGHADQLVEDGHLVEEDKMAKQQDEVHADEQQQEENATP